MKSLKGLAVALSLMLGSALHADDSLFQIHGFGGWSYGKSSDLTFAGGDTKGNASNAQFALNVSARPYERLSIVSQVNLVTDSDKENDIDLDYAFAEWQASDQIRFRVGRVKHPLGLYGEVFDVGTVRPFQNLPQSIYGPLGFTAKAYNGAGITGSVRRGSWEVQYDAYAGEIDGDYGLALPPSPLATPAPSPNDSPWQDIGFRYRDVIGARVQVHTPVDGLMFGGSVYSGTDDFVSTTIVTEVDRFVYVGSAELARGPVTVRAEWGSAESETLHTTESGYVEASFRVTQKWQLASRWETLDLEVPAFGPTFAGPLASVLEHEDLAFGVNYWLNSNFVVRANYHMVEGNRLAHPDTNREFLQMLGSGKLPDTNTLVVGAQFSF